MRFKSIIYSGSFLPGFFHLEPRIEALDTKMILFVNHNTDRLILTENNRTIPGFIRKTWTDEMFLRQHPFVELVNIDLIQRMKIPKGMNVIVLKYFAQLIQHLFRLLIGSQHRKRNMLKVACNPDTAANDDFGISRITAHPVAERLLCKAQIRHYASLLLMTNFTPELFLFQVP
ncbi:hypothetical protein D3C76_1162740 [compost metagenome]